MTQVGDDAMTTTESSLVDRVLDEGFLAGDPFPALARLRDEAPVARHDATGAWVLSRHADVVAAARDPETFCSGKGILLMEIGADCARCSLSHSFHSQRRSSSEPGYSCKALRVYRVLRWASNPTPS